MVESPIPDYEPDYKPQDPINILSDDPAEIAKRQSGGLFTLREAADQIAKQNSEISMDPLQLASRMADAVVSKKMASRLTLRSGGGRKIDGPWLIPTILVTEEDVNEWLTKRHRVDWRWKATKPKVAVTADEAAAAQRLLATREELIAAFGAHTGMSAQWFSNLTHVPGLLKARRMKGRGGRNRIVPLFCPYAVMLWLVSKRSIGRPISVKAAWRMLRAHFPDVYQLYAIGDPN